MKRLCAVPVSMQHYTGSVDVVQWSHGDDFPALGPCVGVDTETELITDTCLAPKVVVLGVFDPSAGKCYVVYWRDIPEFMRNLCSRDVQQRYFNLGFDEQVLDNEDEDAPLITAIDQGRVRDMQIRIHLHEVATLGYIRHNLHSLAGCTLQYENWELDKGDGTENSARLSFRRYNEDGSDYVITDEQARYLPFDCISTWCLGEAVPEQPTEVAHTKGMVVLAHISANGMPIDSVVFDFMEKKLMAHRDKYRDELLTYGFPDPYRDTQQEAADVCSMLHAQYEKLIARAGLQSGIEPDAEGVKPPPSKLNLKYAIMYLYAHEHEPSELELLCKNMKTVMEWKRSGLRKAEQELWNTLCEQHGLASVDAMTKAVAMQAYVMQMLTCVNDQLDSLDMPEYDFAEAVASADDLLDKHPAWCTSEPEIGPRKFFQSHVKNLLEGHPGLELDTTEKSGEIKLTLKDMWRLEDRDIHDKFLSSYTNYNHCVKLLSTYMNREYIKTDGRVHPRFTNILRTGRTSCSSPNVQNLPSRDKVFALKNVYTAFPGMLLCATDFSFVELVNLAESCIQRFGFSIMGDIINAGVDPHRWFAGVRKRIIDSKTDFTKDPKAVEEMNAFLKENISHKERQDSKAAKLKLALQGVIPVEEESELLEGTWQLAV